MATKPAMKKDRTILGPAISFATVPANKNQLLTKTVLLKPRSVLDSDNVEYCRSLTFLPPSTTNIDLTACPVSLPLNNDSGRSMV
jgi:hypothetical protein